MRGRDAAHSVVPMTQAQDAPARLRVLFSFFRPHAGRLVVGTVLGLVATATVLWTPMVVEEVMDALAAGRSMSRPIVLLTVLTVVGIVAMFVQWLVLGRVGENVVYDARTVLVRRFFRGRVRDVAAHPAGELVSRATSDALLLRDATAWSPAETVNAVVAIVGTVVLMGVIDPVLLALTLVAIVVFGGIMAAVMPRLGAARASAQEALGRMGGELESGVRALRTVKVVGAEQRQTEAVMTQARTARTHGIRAMVAEAAAWTAAAGGIQAATVAIVAVGAWRVSEGHLTVAALVAFLMYVFSFSAPMTALATALSDLTSGMAAAQRIAEVQRIQLEEPTGTALDAAATSDEPADGALQPAGTRSDGPTEVRERVAAPAQAPERDAPVLEFRGVTASYGPGRQAVRDLTLRIPRTGHVALVGPSGAGKSSVLALALRFLDPEAGQVLLDGVPYADLTYAQVRGRFAYVEQETPVVPTTIRDNLLFAAPHGAEAELDQVLGTVMLADDLADLPDGLDTSLVSSAVSGGQRQRIAMARALLRHAEILLLDEATSQVDAHTETAIHQAVRAAAAHGAVVTVAHRLSTVLDADTIVVMEDGAVRASGTHPQLLDTDALYHDLVTALRINDGA